MIALIISILVICAILVFSIVAYRIREKSIQEFNSKRYVSRFILNHLTQQYFTKTVNIVMDLVNTDGADIEVTYNGQVIFNGYIDRDDETGKDTPHFWYNKEVLDRHGIIY